MEIEKIIDELKKSWKKVYVWDDAAQTAYETHSHKYDTRLIIQRGSINFTVNGEKHLLTAGDDFIIKAGQLHSAHVGKEGCTYVVAEGRK